ncbi:MAG: TRAP transporter substrate-binding protein [Treponema sp.]|nr:TRAP transporter substrate-binding protein [Treponema sp.]
MKRVKLVCMLFALLAVAISCERRDGVIRVNASQSSSTQSPWHHATVAFADYINEHSDGRFDVHVFANAALSQGSSAIQTEQTQQGALQISIESLTVLAAFNENTGILQLPFTFSDVDHVYRFLQLNDPTWERWMRDFEQSNFVILGASPRPMRQSNNNLRMIRTPDDIQGMRMRVPMNPFFVSIFETMGAVPVPAPAVEIYTGIQLGTFNGEDNSIHLQYDFRTFEVARYFSIVNYIADLTFVIANRDFYHSLSAEDRQLFRRAAQEFVRVDMAENEAYLHVAMEGGRRLGVEFWVMPEENRQLFIQRLAPFYAAQQARYSPADWDAFHDAVRRSAH